MPIRIPSQIAVDCKSVHSECIPSPQVGAVTYGNQAYRQFDLNSFTDVDSLGNAILRMSWNNEDTNVADALRLIRTDMLISMRGDRQDVPNVGMYKNEYYSSFT